MFLRPVGSVSISTGRTASQATFVPSTLPEMRACFKQSARVVMEQGEIDTIERHFEAASARGLLSLRPEDDDSMVIHRSQHWLEVYGEQVAKGDTLLVGFRADVSAQDATAGRFRHSYIAWSKQQAATVAQGGCMLTCSSKVDNALVPLPASWVNRMEVDHGEMWASVQILAFRRGVGLPTQAGEGVDADSSEDRLVGR